MIKSIAVDLDGTINPDPAEARRVLTRLKEENVHIIIWTGRCRRHDRASTLKWLSEHNIPYDEIIFNKPEADVFLDDHAVRFTDWKTAEKMVRE